jgi:hypothetical protein
VNLAVACDVAAGLCTEELERLQAFVGATLRARYSVRDLDEVEPRRTWPSPDTEPAPPALDSDR